MLRYVVFFSVVIAIVGGMHWFFWARLVRDTHVPLPWRTWATLAVVTVAVSLPLSLVGMRRLPGALSRLLAWPIFVWIGFMFLLFLTLLAARLAITVWWRVAGPGPPDPARRLLLARALSSGATIGTAVVGALAVTAIPRST